MKKIIVGGEFYYSPALLFSKRSFSLSDYLAHAFPEKKYSFSYGGYYSILQILKTIKIQANELVLLPSYICPTILIPFKKQGVKYQFYRIRENLEIDIDDIGEKMKPNVKALFFINYFGFPVHPKVKNFLNSLKSQGIIIIEDCVQSFFSDIPTIGTYTFNSFRKFLPLDGSVILSDKSVPPIDGKSYNQYFFYKLFGQIIRYLHVEYNVFPATFFLRLFKTAEKQYYSNSILLFNAYNRFILSRCNIDRLKRQRVSNFKDLLSRFPVVSLFKNIPDSVVPLGFPVLIRNRDLVHEKLAGKNIFCPIHWKLSPEVDRVEFKESWDIAEHILTIPINESVDEKELNYIVKTLNSLSLISALPA